MSWQAPTPPPAPGKGQGSPVPAGTSASSAPAAPAPRGTIPVVSPSSSSSPLLPSSATGQRASPTTVGRSADQEETSRWWPGVGGVAPSSSGRANASVSRYARSESLRKAQSVSSSSRNGPHRRHIRATLSPTTPWPPSGAEGVRTSLGDDGQLRQSPSPPPRVTSSTSVDAAVTDGQDRPRAPHPAPPATLTGAVTSTESSAPAPHPAVVATASPAPVLTAGSAVGGGGSSSTVASRAAQRRATLPPLVAVESSTREPVAGTPAPAHSAVNKQQQQQSATVAKAAQEITGATPAEEHAVRMPPLFGEPTATSRGASPTTATVPGGVAYPTLYSMSRAHTTGSHGGGGGGGVASSSSSHWHPLGAPAASTVLEDRRFPPSPSHQGYAVPAHPLSTRESQRTGTSLSGQPLFAYASSTHPEGRQVPSTDYFLSAGGSGNALGRKVNTGASNPLNIWQQETGFLRNLLHGSGKGAGAPSKAGGTATATRAVGQVTAGGAEAEAAAPPPPPPVSTGRQGSPTPSLRNNASTAAAGERNGGTSPPPPLFASESPTMRLTSAALAAQAQSRPGLVASEQHAVRTSAPAQGTTGNGGKASDPPRVAGGSSIAGGGKGSGLQRVGTDGNGDSSSPPPPPPPPPPPLCSVKPSGSSSPSPPSSLAAESSFLSDGAKDALTDDDDFGASGGHNTRTRNINALRAFSWDQRVFLPKQRGLFAPTFTLFSSPRFWERCDWAARGALLTILPTLILTLEPTTTGIFPLRTSVVALAFWISQPTLGAGLREVYVVLKGFSISLVILCIIIAIQPGPAWLSLLLLFISILIVSFVAEQMKRTCAYCLASLIMQYISKPQVTTYAYVGDYFLTLLIALGFGLAAFFVPFIRWSSDVARHYIAVMGDSVSLSARGACLSFWTSSPLERQLHLARLRQLRVTIDESGRKAAGGISETGYEPHTGKYTAQLRTRIGFLRDVGIVLQSMLLVLELVAEDPTAIDTLMCNTFGEKIQPELIVLAAALDETLLKISDLNGSPVTKEDIDAFRVQRDRYNAAVAVVREEVILNNVNYQTAEVDVLLGSFLFCVEQLCNYVANFKENPNPPNNFLYFLLFPKRDLDSLVAATRSLWTTLWRRGTLTRRMKEAIKLSLCIVIAGFFQVYGMKNESTSPVAGVDIIALVYKPTGAESFQYATNRLMGTVLGSLTGLFSVQIADGRLWVLYICVAVLCFIGCYVQAAPTSFPLGNAISNSVISIVIQYKNQNSAIVRIQQNCFAILIYFIISSVIWPIAGRTKVKLGFDLSLRLLREAVYRLLHNLDRPGSEEEVSSDVFDLLTDMNKRIGVQSGNLAGAIAEPTMESAAFPDMPWRLMITAQQKLYATLIMMHNAYHTFMSSSIGEGTGLSVHWVILHRITPYANELSEHFYASVEVYLLTLSKATLVPTSQLSWLRQRMARCQRRIVQTYIDTLQHVVAGSVTGDSRAGDTDMDDDGDDNDGDWGQANAAAAGQGVPPGTPGKPASAGPATDVEKTFSPFPPQGPAGAQGSRTGGGIVANDAADNAATRTTTPGGKKVAGANGSDTGENVDHLSTVSATGSVHTAPRERSKTPKRKSGYLAYKLSDAERAALRHFLDNGSFFNSTLTGLPNSSIWLPRPPGAGDSATDSAGGRAGSSLPSPSHAPTRAPSGLERRDGVHEEQDGASPVTAAAGGGGQGHPRRGSGQNANNASFFPVAFPNITNNGSFFPNGTFVQNGTFAGINMSILLGNAGGAGARGGQQAGAAGAAAAGGGGAHRGAGNVINTSGLTGSFMPSSVPNHSIFANTSALDAGRPSQPANVQGQEKTQMAAAGQKATTAAATAADRHGVQAEGAHNDVVTPVPLPAGVASSPHMAAAQLPTSPPTGPAMGTTNDLFDMSFALRRGGGGGGKNRNASFFFPLNSTFNFGRGGGGGGPDADPATQPLLARSGGPQGAQDGDQRAPLTQQQRHVGNGSFLAGDNTRQGASRSSFAGPAVHHSPSAIFSPTGPPPPSPLLPGGGGALPSALTESHEPLATDEPTADSPRPPPAKDGTRRRVSIAEDATGPELRVGDNVRTPPSPPTAVPATAGGGGGSSSSPSRQAKYASRNAHYDHFGDLNLDASDGEVAQDAAARVSSDASSPHSPRQEPHLSSWKERSKASFANLLSKLNTGGGGGGAARRGSGLSEAFPHSAGAAGGSGGGDAPGAGFGVPDGGGLTNTTFALLGPRRGNSVLREIARDAPDTVTVSRSSSGSRRGHTGRGRGVGGGWPPATDGNGNGDDDADTTPSQPLGLSAYNDTEGELVLTNSDMHSLHAFLFGVGAMLYQLEELEQQLLEVVHGNEMAKKL